MLNDLRQEIRDYLHSHPVLMKVFRIAPVVILVFGIGVDVGLHAGVQKVQVWKSILQAPEPEVCVICGEGWRYHAPCLVGLTTGSVAELEIYDPHPRLFAEIADTLQGGIIRMSGRGEISVITDPGSQWACACVSVVKEDMDPQYFCRNCRALFADYIDDGYVFIDLYDLENVRVYPVKDGETIQIRDYTIIVEVDKKWDKINIENSAHIFDGPTYY